MVNNRRSEMEIIAEILTLTQNGAKKTEILYKGYLSYNQLNKYINFLIEKDILSEKNVQNNGSSSKFYFVTNRGNEFLKDINKILAYFK